MKVAMIVKSVAFFCAGALAAAKDELIVMARVTQQPITWADVFAPLTTIKALEMGFVVLVAFLVQSPLPKKFIAQRMGGILGEAEQSDPTSLPEGVKVDSDAAPEGTFEAASVKSPKVHSVVFMIEDE